MSLITYYVETFGNGFESTRYPFEQLHHVSEITAADDMEALQKGEVLASKINHGIYNLSTKDGFDDCELPQPIWDFFNGWLR